MPTPTVRPVGSGRDRKRFIDFQYAHYQGNESFVPPLRLDLEQTLDPKKNPFFAHGKMELFLAEDAGGQVVGRIAAIVNGMHLQKYDDGNGFFGFFECVDDYGVAAALFDAAAAWLRGQGLRGVRGPTNPSMNDVAGLLVGGFDRQPSILMPYNDAYYAGFLERYGFTRAMTMWAYYVHKKYVRTDKMRRGVELVKKRNPGVHLRPLDMRRYYEEAQAILDIYNDAWSRNWGHVPMTQAEFNKLAKDLKQVVDPRIVYLLEEEGKPIGFSISLPNLNLALRHVRDGRLLPLGLPKLLAYSNFGGIYEVRMPLMGVRQSHQGRGLDALLVLETIDQGPRIGYDACEMSWVLDNNHVMRNSLESMGGVVDKEYAMFEKTLV
jgi:GNAT superfamily N-acetyltransferase